MVLKAEGNEIKLNKHRKNLDLLIQSERVKNFLVYYFYYIIFSSNVTAISSRVYTDKNL
jgi:hypothetical protein